MVSLASRTSTARYSRGSSIVTRHAASPASSNCYSPAISSISINFSFTKLQPHTQPLLFVVLGAGQTANSKLHRAFGCSCAQQHGTKAKALLGSSSEIALKVNFAAKPKTPSSTCPIDVRVLNCSALHRDRPQSPTVSPCWRTALVVPATTCLL